MLDFECHLQSSSDLPWLVVGDSSEILSSDEKIGRDQNNWKIENFRNAISDACSFDIGFEGPKFTWKGPKHGNNFFGLV